MHGFENVITFPHFTCSCLQLVYAVLLLSCFSSQCIVGAQRLGNTTDEKALLDFKAKITSDPLGVFHSWNHSIHFCQWHGVTCGHRHQRVVALKLNSSRLDGSISPHLGNLSFLRVLSLANNSFHNEIPEQVWHLVRLEQLLLSSNSISGVLPSNISCSPRFQVLDLRNNLLSGEIPIALGCSSHLQYLGLRENGLLGNIPPSLGNLSSLKTLNVGFNTFTGVVPETLGQLKNLTFLSLEHNRLSGPISTSIFNLSYMTTFGLGTNQFEGTLPPEMGTSMPYLEYIGAFENHFTGRIPPSISNCTHLKYLYLVHNRFTGSLPFLPKLNNLIRLALGDNQLGSRKGETDLSFLCSLGNDTVLESLELEINLVGGVIPTCVGNLSTSLKLLSFIDNYLWGQIPSTIGNLVNLEWFSVAENQISGSIPSTIGNLVKLKYLFLDKNNLSGDIPSSLGNLKALTKLTLDGNNLHGSIPPSLGNCSNLIGMTLSFNRLTGSIPPLLFEFAPFSIGLYLEYNLLTGRFPQEVGNLKQIGELNVSRNLLFGNIPSTIGACTSLGKLDMSGNLFQGTIPPSLASLRGLQLLDLSDNNLTGEIPTFLVSFKLLATLNLSHNDFEGLVPSQGIFSNRSAIFLNGNKKLCGGIPQLHLPKCSLRETSTTWKKAVIIVSLALGMTFILIFILILFLRKKRNKLRSIEAEAPLQFPELSYHELFSATNGFSSSNLIGVGSFGSVYKGILNQGGKLVAIKVLNLLQQGAYKSFLAECEALRNVRHRNLVKILTVCSSVDQQGKDFKALVCELMSNGSLEQWLHKKTEIGCSNQTQRFLSLLQRLDIAADVACALDYLHNQCPTPIVHCDLKPSNVLLDDNMTAHLGDFGLAKFLPTSVSGSSQSGTSSIGVRGTIGYTPPEYGLGNDVSTYGDVYSYGVLLLEIFSGKRPTDEMFQEGLDLHHFAKSALPESVWKIIDPVLVQENQEPRGLSNVAAVNRGSKLFGRIQECLILLIGIGVKSSAELPRERMNMSDVVAQLSSIKRKLLQAGTSRTQQH